MKKNLVNKFLVIIGIAVISASCSGEFTGKLQKNDNLLVTSQTETGTIQKNDIVANFSTKPMTVDQDLNSKPVFSITPVKKENSSRKIQPVTKFQKLKTVAAKGFQKEINKLSTSSSITVVKEKKSSNLEGNLRSAIILLAVGVILIIIAGVLGGPIGTIVYIVGAVIVVVGLVLLLLWLLDSV